MNSIVAGAVPIAGTLLGAALTYALWARSARQARGFALRQQLWQERLVTYSSFAGAMTEARRSLKDRWHLEQGDPGSAAFVAAQAESYRLRARATAQMCWVQLVGGRAGLAWLAGRALDAATEVHLAVDEGDRAARGRQARLALQDFLVAASGDVGEPAAGSEDAISRARDAPARGLPATGTAADLNQPGLVLLTAAA